METGLYHYRNRYYSAELGRFVNRDPVQADVNLYRYCGDNPVISVDPTGLDVEWYTTVDGYTVKYVVVRQEWRPPNWMGGILYPGPWGQLASATSGSYSSGWGMQTTVNLSGGNVCNTVVVGTASSLDAGEIRASVYLGDGCYEVFWNWEVSSDGNATAGTAKVTAPSGALGGTKLVLPSTTLTAGFHDAGARTTYVTGCSGFFSDAEVSIAIYDPTLSRADHTGSDGKTAESHTTGRITILRIKKL